MTTNKEWLNSLDSDELKAWLNADRPNDNLAPEKVVTFDYGYSNDANGDSRAQLEADITNWLGSWTAFSVPTSTVKEAVLGWLDRQAAISEAKVERKWSCYEGSVQAEIDRLNLCIAELAAKPRSDLAQRMEVDSLENRIFDQQNRIDELQAQVDKLTADLLASNQEREHWRNVCGKLIDKTHEMQSIYDEGLA